jgi:hypothetical protein
MYHQTADFGVCFILQPGRISQRFISDKRKSSRLSQTSSTMESMGHQTRSGLSFKPPGLKWQGQESITSAQLIAETDAVVNNRMQRQTCVGPIGGGSYNSQTTSVTIPTQGSQSLKKKKQARSD